jgi:outer membrane protein
MKANLKFSIVIVTILFHSMVSPLSAQSLSDALVNSYNNSGLLEQNRALLRAADENTVIASSALLPIVSWAANFSGNWTETETVGSGTGVSSSDLVWRGTVGLNSSLTIFDGGTNKFAADVTKQNVLATRQGLISLEQRVMSSAVSAFMGVLEGIETVRLREKNYSVIEEELRAARDRYEVGEITRTDVALAEARLASSSSALSAAKGLLVQAEAIYKNSVGVLPVDLVAPKEMPALPKTINEALSIATSSHPELRQLQYQIKASELTVKRIKASSKAKMILNGDIGISDSDVQSDTLQASIGLRLSGTIYQGGSIRAKQRQALANLQAVRSALHVQMNAIEQRISSSFAMLEVAKTTRAALEKQIEAAEVAFNGVKEEASLGARTTLDVLNAEQELLDAKSQFINAIYDEYMAAYDVLSASGLLTVDNLNLPVAKYDPEEYYKSLMNNQDKRFKDLKILNLLKELNEE